MSNIYQTYYMIETAKMRLRTEMESLSMDTTQLRNIHWMLTRAAANISDMAKEVETSRRILEEEE